MIRLLDHTRAVHPASPTLSRVRFPTARYRGFTLIELLVVVGIITVLLAILIPSLTAARRETRRVVCQANLKQVVFGWHGYLEENRGVFPRMALGDVNYGGRQGMQKLYQVPKRVNKQLKLPPAVDQGAEVFSCLDDAGGGADPNYASAGEIGPSFFRHYGTSYLANPLLAGPTPFAMSAEDPCNKWLSTPFKNDLPSLKAGQLDHESKLLLVADGVWQKAWNYSNKETIRQWHGHPRKHNVGFMDGHADFVEIRKGIYVTSQYSVLPTTEMQNLALPHQAEPQR